MAQTHDTIDGLLAEFRGYSAGMPPSYHVTMSWADFRKMLDRFDAALKREVAVSKTETPTNAVKLREALEYMFMLIDGRHLVLECETTEEISGVQCKLAEARAALAAPPRNCDRYNDRVEMYGVFKDWCNARGHTMEPKLAYDAFEWLLATATEKEGGAK